MTLSMATTFNDNDPITHHPASQTNTVKQQEQVSQHQHKSDNVSNKEETDSAVSQLLARLDEGAQTIANLRSILTLKTAELSELMSQLEMTNQAISHVESTTGHIETMLKDLGLTHTTTTPTNIDTTKDLLISAEASLDSAIQSAMNLYASSAGPKQQKRPLSTSSGGNRSQPTPPNLPSSPHQQQSLPHPRFVSRIRYKPDTKHLLRQLTDRLRDLELDAGKFFETIGTTSDVQALQKAYVDLDLAETIALSAKSNLKRRKILLTSSRRRQGMDQVTLLGDKIREGVDMWKTYTRNAPMKVNGEDILVILKLQDQLLDKQGSTPTRMSMDLKRGNSPTQSNSSSSSSSYQPPSSRHWRQSQQTLSPSNSGTTTTAPSARRHRSTSVSSVSSIPMPIAAPPPPLPTATSKKFSSAAATSHYRHSTSAATSYRTPQIKANLGVSRVRTSSLTHKNKDVGQSPPVTPPTAQQDTVPPPVKTNLKLPTQRGPGSTLRIRSMLAKRNPQPTPLS